LIDGGDGSFQIGFIGLKRPVGLIHFLLGNAVEFQQVLVASGSDARQIQVGLRLRLGGFSLAQLLIELGRLNLRQELARRHVGADIHLPALDISVSARIDGSLDVTLKIGGDRDVELGGARLGWITLTGSRVLS